jgi:hypothetical protein
VLRQTIALFQYQLVGAVNRRLLALLLVLYLVVFLAGQFAAELAIINSELLLPAFQAELIRYGLVLALSVVFCVRVVAEYERAQFERLLSMPVSRLQYVLAQYLLIVVFALACLVPALVLLWVSAGSQLAVYWFVALALELVLVGQFALLAAISLGNLAAAVLFTLGFYLLCRVAPVLDVVFARSMDFYGEERGFQFMHQLFGVIRYILPDARVFASNNQFFEPLDMAELLPRQLLALAIYSGFILSVLLVDFYRKEFNRS